MKSKHRVVVWGPGGLGAVAIREVLAQPHLDLVGVFAYSPEKVGRDAGELVGVDPCGITVTGDPGQALAIDCDCVLYLARDMGNYHFTTEILQIVAAGKNLISVLPMQSLKYLGEGCDPQFPEKLRQACEQGRSSFHCTGISPAFVSERLALPLTGLCNDITEIKVQENWDVRHISAPQLEVCGYGMAPDEAKKQPFAPMIARNYLHVHNMMLADAMGYQFDRTEIEHEFVPSPVDVTTEFMSIRAGTVGRVTHRHKGYIDARGPEPFQVLEVNWVLTEANFPEGITSDQYYVVALEGRPSVKMKIDIQSSFHNPQHFVVPDDPGSEPGYYATVSTCLQAIPAVVAAKPGIVDAPICDWHWQMP